MKKLLLIFIAMGLVIQIASAQKNGSWGDRGDSYYKNPILESNFPDNDMIYGGDLKAVFLLREMYDHYGGGRWELYDEAKDHTEQHDFAAERPDELKKLPAEWMAWADRSQVFPAPGGSKKEKAKTKAAPDDQE